MNGLFVTGKTMADAKSNNPPFSEHVESSTVDAVPAAAQLPPQSQLGGVLVVEDDPLVTEVIFDLLSSLGLFVLTANDGSEAISIFENSSSNIFCVILDFDIPGLHSSRVYSRFREINSQVKVLLSSGYPESDILSEFSFAEIDGFIPKPYDPQLLIGELAKLRRE